MRALLAVEVDDGLLAAHVERLAARFTDGVTWPAPADYFVERLIDNAADGLRSALYGWEDLGLTVTVEEVSL